MRRLRTAAALLALPLALAACSSSSPAAKPSPTSPSASPTTDPAAALAHLATISAAGFYTASYTVTGDQPGRASVVRTPNGYRFELSTGTGNHARHAVLIRTIAGTVSCTLVPKPVTCLKVAGPGKPVPAVFDAGLQHVFSDYLTQLSRVSSTYVISDALVGTTSGQCFDVALAATPPPTGAVAAGTYCFDPDGVPTRVSYPSGSLLLRARGGAPKGKDFVPPVPAKPLP